MANERKPLSDFENWEKQDLEQFLDSERAQEGFDIEFKGAEAIKDKDILSKTISAFANTQGGYLFLGIEEEKKEGKTNYSVKTGIPRSEYHKGTVVDILNSCTNPNYLDIKVKEIKWDEKNSVFIVYIPEFTVTPIQARDWKYYRRFEGGSKPIPEDLVRALYFKMQHPNIIIEFEKINLKWKLIEHTEYLVFNIRAILENKSHIKAQDIEVKFNINNAQIFKDNHKVQWLKKNYEPKLSGLRGPFFGGEKRIHTLILTSRHYPTVPNYFAVELGQSHGSDCRPILGRGFELEYIIYADNAPPNKGKIDISELFPGRSISWEELQPLQEFE